MFGTVLSPALEILDQGKVTKFVCQQSKRCFYRIKEPKRSAKTDKDTAVEAHFDVMGEFCPCFYYAKQCLDERGSSLICKHVLAVKLALAIGEGTPFRDKLCVKEIEDIDFQPLYLSSKMHVHKYDDANQLKAKRQ